MQDRSLTGNRQADAGRFTIFSATTAVMEGKLTLHHRTRPAKPFEERGHFK